MKLDFSFVVKLLSFITRLFRRTISLYACKRTRKQNQCENKSQEVIVRVDVCSDTSKSHELNNNIKEVISHDKESN